MWQFLNKRTVFPRTDSDLLVFHFFNAMQFWFICCFLEGFAHVILVCRKADAMLLRLSYGGVQCNTGCLQKKKEENECSIKQ